MDLTDLLIEQITDDYIYEDKYMKVIKIIKEIPTGSKNYVKRVQLVVWKNKNTDVPDLDIRNYSYKEKRYAKGITLTMKEAEMLYESLTDFLNESNNSN
ncbi:MAG TPA: hypothetical protein GX708_15865 [Gallicola sp.]|nr:hypothetical protein [Gallicola sp.]